MTAALVLCGALAREVIAMKERCGWDVELFGVASSLHLRPAGIAPAVEQRLRELIPRFPRVAVVYGDCGTAGALDDLLERYRVPRVAGPHCYEMYAGPAFDALVDHEPGTFFLTDFLVRAFDGAVRRGLGLDRYPELRDSYFGAYRRVVYLVQREDPALLERARVIAAELGLALEVRPTGYGPLEGRLAELLAEIHAERYAPALPPEPLFGGQPAVPPPRSRRRGRGAGE
ncbi:MAG: hypothetical protein RLZZ387_27 [Chloroflexota bacterium]